jgi:hydrogenase maturation factor
MLDSNIKAFSRQACFNYYGGIDVIPSRNHKTPIVVTGFEPVDLFKESLMCVQQQPERRIQVRESI